MADVGLCDPSGCYGKCPTSTRCCQRIVCPPCPPAPFLQRLAYGCGCRCPGLKVKDCLNVVADDIHFFQNYYNIFRSSPRLPNKRSQMPKGPAMKGKKGKGRGKEAGRDAGGVGGKDAGKYAGSDGGGEQNKKKGGLFENYDDEGSNEDGGGTGGTGGSRNRQKPSKEARLKNKLNTLFDEALRNGLLNEPKRGKKNKKHTPEYYKNVLNINVSCVRDCEPLCCDDEN